MREATSPTTPWCHDSSNRHIVVRPATATASIAVQCVELLRQCQPTLEAVGDEALDSDGHVVQTPRCVDAWADRKAEVGGARRSGIAARHLEQCRDTRVQTAAADP